jgi:hypothetical protein
MPVLYTNNAVSGLSASITNTVTSFSVTSGHGVKFPAISGADYFYVTLTDIAGNIEIVKVTGRSTDTFTVVRGQDGTTGLAFSAFDRVELRVTKAVLDDIKADTKSSLASANVTTALGFTPISASSTDTLTNKRIQPRVLSAASATTFAVNADSYDVAEMIMTGVAGTLAVGNPTGTPINGQKLIYKLQTTNVQTYNWGTIFQGSTDLALPGASSGSAKWDFYGFIYNSTAAKWQLIAKMAGF